MVLLYWKMAIECGRKSLWISSRLMLQKGMFWWYRTAIMWWTNRKPTAAGNRLFNYSSAFSENNNKTTFCFSWQKVILLCSHYRSKQYNFVCKKLDMIKFFYQWVITSVYTRLQRINPSCSCYLLKQIILVCSIWMCDTTSIT